MANNFLNGNQPVVKFGTLDVSPQWIDYSLSASNSATDVTAGAGATHILRKPGLDDTSLSASFGYTTVTLELTALLPKLRPGSEWEIEIGPEGDTVGKPKHVQKFIITSVEFGQNVKKAAVVFKIKADGAEAPTVNINAGGVYAV